MAFLFMLFISCDPPVYMDIDITNNCEQAISVDGIAEPYPVARTEIKYSIEPHATQCVYQCRSIIGYTKKNIPYYIKRLNITKGGKRMTDDPLNLDRWQFEKFSKRYYKSSLTINPEDFE